MEAAIKKWYTEEDDKNTELGSVEESYLKDDKKATYKSIV